MEPCQANSKGMLPPSDFESLKDIRRISAGTNRKGHIAWFNEVVQLFRKNIFVARIIGPCSHHWNAVGKSNRAKTFAMIAWQSCSFCEVAGKVGG